VFLILLCYLSFLIAKKEKIINKKLSSGVGLVMDLSLFLLGLSQCRFLRLVQEDSFSCFYVSFVLLCYLSFPVAKKRKKEKKVPSGVGLVMLSALFLLGFFMWKLLSPTAGLAFVVCFVLGLSLCS
jgi:hypothetical protein